MKTFPRPAPPAMLVLLLGCAIAMAQEQWFWRHPLPAGNLIRKVAWSENAFRAVGDFGTLLTSPDGEAWTAKNTGSANGLNRIARFKDHWVAVGDYGTILLSRDGETWSKQASGTTNDLLALACGADLCVAGGRVGPVLTSSDGLAWDTVKAPDITYADFATNGKTWVGIGGNTTCLLSADGKSWSNFEIPDAGWIGSIVWKAPLFVAAGALGRKAGIFRSPDGSHWESQALNDSGAVWDLQWDGKAFVARLGPDTLITSPDALTWTRLPVKTVRPLYATASSGHGYVLMGDYGSHARSADGKAWTYRDPDFTQDIRDVVWIGSKAIAVGDSGLIVSSGDGLTWKREASGTKARLNSLAWNGKLLLAVGDSGVVLTSADGSVWAKQSLDLADSHVDAVWTGRFFAVLTLYSFYPYSCVSADGRDWSRIRMPERASDLRSFIWADTQLVAFSGKYLAWTSKDGNVWKESSIIQTPSLAALSSALKFNAVWTGTEMVAPVSDPFNGKTDMIKSRDLVNWEAVEIDSLVVPTGVLRTDDGFLFFGGTEILRTRDLKTWTRQRVNRPITAAAWDGKRFLGVGTHGSILASPLPGETGILARPTRAATAPGPDRTWGADGILLFRRPSGARDGSSDFFDGIGRSR